MKFIIIYKFSKNSKVWYMAQNNELPTEELAYKLKDTLQVGAANSIGITMSITECNEILTLVSLVLAIAFTIYKFIKFDKNA